MGTACDSNKGSGWRGGGISGGAAASVGKYVDEDEPAP